MVLEFFSTLGIKIACELKIEIWDKITATSEKPHIGTSTSSLAPTYKLSTTKSSKHIRKIGQQNVYGEVTLFWQYQLPTLKFH